MFRNPALSLLSIISFFCACTQSPEDIYDLRCENLSNPLSIDNVEPRLSWKIRSGVNGDLQTAYRVLVATDPSLLEEGKADLWDSEKVPSSESVMLKYSGKDLSGKTLVYWKVRVWDKEDNISSWSETAYFGTGLTQHELAEAAYIGSPKTERNPQSPLLRKKFQWNGNSRKVLLYVNSLGYHEIYINGKRAGEPVLAPAVSQLNKRSLYNTCDVTSLLKKGENDLVVWLGQGWYRPEVYAGANDGPLAKILIKEQKAGEWATLLVSDNSWQAGESGYTGIGNWRPHHFGGERIDAAKVPENMTSPALDKLEWLPAIVAEVPDHAVSPQMSEGNRITQSIKPKSLKQLSDSTWLVDMGKALTGYVEVHFPVLQKGQEINLVYFDHFNDKGKPANREQTDCYIASGKGKEIFRNRFNYHAYQYIIISNLPQELTIDDITGHLIQTDFKPVSSFRCSDQDMNVIHDMIQYTLRCLSLGGYLVDCPHIERLGYGGDGNACTETAQTMFDLSPLYANWMRAWGDCIRPDGSMPHTAPNPYSAGGGPYWCGFIITASWRTYVNYGDSRLIEKYYPDMQLWLDYVDKYSVDGLLKPWPVTEYRNWYLGDWACPEGVDQTGEKSVDVVNNCFISVCYDNMEKIARFLGKEDDAQEYARKNEELKKLIQEKLYSGENGIYGNGSQIDLAYPMLAGVTPEAFVPRITEKLFYETEVNRKGHIACGLVGVPVITEWAVKNNRPEFIYSMLKKRDYPGYLYMIDNGATTTWEHWNGQRSRIHNCYNGIGSWFYRAVGGIRPDENEPGYKKIWIDPQIPKGITWAKTSRETPYGLLSVDWELKDNAMSMEITVPVGSVAHVVLPESAKEYTLNAKTVTKGDEHTAVLGSGKYKLTIDN
jgi:alpha-L-rhamnosidase